MKKIKTLGVCAPSARFDKNQFFAGVKVIENLGLKLIIPDEIFHLKRYLAGEDIQRAKVINHLFSNQKVDGLICARGGFGAMRVLNYLDWDLIKKNPKPVIGFSDATALLTAIMDRTGQEVIHGPTVTSIGDAGQATIKYFNYLVKGKTGTIKLENGTTIKSGTALGTLKGGNLSTLSHLFGTPFQPRFDDCIVFFEDINEPAYKLDRMLTQMKMAGAFEKVKGVVAGSFKGCEHPEYIDEIFFESFEEYKVPVLSGLSAGHDGINLSLAMGRLVKLDTYIKVLEWV